MALWNMAARRATNMARLSSPSEHSLLHRRGYFDHYRPPRTNMSPNLRERFVENFSPILFAAGVSGIFTVLAAGADSQIKKDEEAKRVTKPGPATRMSPQSVNSFVPLVSKTPNPSPVGPFDLSGLSIEDALLLKDFAQHHGDLVLCSEHPKIYHVMVYSLFASFLRRIKERSLYEWLTTNKSELEDFLATFEQIGLKCSWLDGLRSVLKVSMLTDEELSALVQVKGDLEGKVNNLKDKVTHLSMELAQANHELETNESKLAEASTQLICANELGRGGPSL